jgi:hypothetical protein
MKDPDSMGGGLPWGNGKMSDEAILAWYKNMHAQHVGNARTMPVMPSAPPVRNYDPNASTGEFLAAQNGALSATMPAMPR